MTILLDFDLVKNLIRLINKNITNFFTRKDINKKILIQKLKNLVKS